MELDKEALDRYITTPPEEDWEECQACGCQGDIGPDGICDRCAKEDSKIEKGERRYEGEE